MGVVTEQLKIDTSGAVRSLEAVSTEAEATHVSLEDAGKGAGRMAEGLSRVGSIATAIDPTLGMVVQRGAGIFQAFRSGAEGAGALGLSAGALVASLGAVVAVGGAGLLFLEHYKEKAEEARAKLDELIAANNQLRTSMEAGTGRQEMARIRIDVAEGRLDASALDSIRAQQQAEQDYAGAVAATRYQLDQAQAAVDDYKAQVKGKDDIGGKAWTDLVAELDRAKGAYQDIQGAINDEAADLTEAADAERRAAKAKQDHIQALQRQQQEMQRARDYWLAALHDAVQVEAAWKEVLQLQYEGQLALGTVDIRTRAAAVGKDLGVSADTARDKLSDLALKVLDVGDAIQKVQEDVDKGVLDPTTGDTYISQLQHQWDAADRAFQTYQRDLAGWRSGKYVSTDRAMQYMGMGTAGLDALTNPLGFMTSDTMAAAAPQVYAVGQALTALQKVGELGASGVRDQLTGLTDDLSAGIRDLPSILADVLPDVFEKGIPSIVEALIEAAPEIALASVKAQVSLVEMLLSDLPQAVGAGMWDALEKFWGELKDFLQHPGQTLSGAAGGARAVAVDAARILAGLATFGTSEIAYGAVNKASGGKLHDALYGDDSSRARSAREASWGGRPSRDLEDQRAFMQLNRGLNQFDRRENATSATGVRYFASGPTRI